MNILVVAAVLPYPLHSGGQIRMYNLLSRLSKKHTITLVSFIRHESEREYAKKLSFCKDVRMILRGRAWQPKYYLRAIVGKYPFLLTTYDNRQMQSEINTLMGNSHFDLIHAEPFYVLPSVAESGVPLVVSEHNVEYEVYKNYVDRFPVPWVRPLMYWDVYKLRNWERMAWKRAACITAVSDDDAQVMKKYGNAPVAVVPNGVDLDSFPLRTPGSHKDFTVLFVGNFRWLPNREALSSLVGLMWPEIRAKIPEAHLMVAGRDLPRDLKNRVMKVGGMVNENVENIAQVYRDADVLVAPHAIPGGTKFKMLEAMASGLPIVTGIHGMAGLHGKPGVHYFDARSPHEYANRLLFIRENPAAVKKVTLAARHLVEAEYNWDTIADILDSVWKKTYAKN
ncbi:glycosyltransferase [Candidatus Gottesmanbacteria bacterium]|nr:glycosyltransferase [Candidatus Gottesmanbacteria bacterium]